jgi:hypothetical protein
MPGVVCWPWSFALFIFRSGFCLSQLDRKKERKKKAHHQRHLNAICAFECCNGIRAKGIYNSIVYFFLEKEIYVAFDYVDYSIYTYNIPAPLLLPSSIYIFSPAFDLFFQRFLFCYSLSSSFSFSYQFVGNMQVSSFNRPPLLSVVQLRWSIARPGIYDLGNQQSPSWRP